MTIIYCEAMTTSRFDMNRMITYSIKYIYQEKSVNPKWDAFYHRGVYDLVTEFILVLGIHLLGHALFGARIAYFFFIKGERVNPLGVILPFTKFDTERGFIINASVNMIFAVGALLANITTEYCVCAINHAIQSMASVILLRIDDLNEILEIGNLKKIPLGIEYKHNVKCRIRDIVMLIQDFDELIYIHFTYETNNTKLIFILDF